MALERGLGKGLDSLFRSTRDAEQQPERDIKKLALTQLVPGPHQPRKYFEETSLSELSLSIRNQGIVQPLIVRPKADSVPQMYEIVAGERRWRAAKLAGLTEVPVVIAAYDDIEAMTVALVENLQRENLNPLEEAEALSTLKEAWPEPGRACRQAWQKQIRRGEFSPAAPAFRESQRCSGSGKNQRRTCQSLAGDK